MNLKKNAMIFWELLMLIIQTIITLIILMVISVGLGIFQSLQEQPLYNKIYSLGSGPKFG